MIRQIVKYIDYDGNEVEEAFYFHLSKAELAEMEMVYSESGGMAAHLERIAKGESPKEIIDAFKDIIARSYGKRSDDGKRFIKSPKISEEFLQTEAFSELFFTLVTDADASTKFVNGVMAQVPALPKPPEEKPTTEVSTKPSETVEELEARLIALRGL
jgi:hypothetical protein